MRGEIQSKEAAKVNSNLMQWMLELHGQMHLLFYAEQYKTDNEAVNAEEYAIKRGFLRFHGIYLQNHIWKCRKRNFQGLISLTK